MLSKNRSALMQKGGQESAAENGVSERRKRISKGLTGNVMKNCTDEGCFAKGEPMK